MILTRSGVASEPSRLSDRDSNVHGGRTARRASASSAAALDIVLWLDPAKLGVQSLFSCELRKTASRCCKREAGPPRLVLRSLQTCSRRCSSLPPARRHRDHGNLLCRRGPRREASGYHGLLHVLLMGVSGAFLTGDLFNLYVWFEVMLVASFVLMALHRTSAQIEAAFKYVTLNLIASSLFLTALGLLYGGDWNAEHGRPCFGFQDARNYDLRTCSRDAVSLSPSA